MRPLAILLCVLFWDSIPVSGQDSQTGAPLQIGIGLSANAYSGDLNYRDNTPVRAYPGINFSLQFENKKPLSFQLNSGFARFTEQKDLLALEGQGEYQPNIFVQTGFFYLDARLRYFFYHKRKIRPFLGAGVGFLSFNPEDQEGDFLAENIFTRLPEEESYLTLVAQFPLQAGIQIRIKSTVSINLSANYRYTASDYLDNVGLFGAKPGKDALLSAQAELVFTLTGNEKPAEAPQKEIPVEESPIVLRSLDHLMDWEDNTAQPASLELRVEPVDYPNFK